MSWRDGSYDSSSSSSPELSSSELSPCVTSSGSSSSLELPSSTLSSCVTSSGTLEASLLCRSVARPRLPSTCEVLQRDETNELNAGRPLVVGVGCRLYQHAKTLYYAVSLQTVRAVEPRRSKHRGMIRRLSTKAIRRPSTYDTLTHDDCKRPDILTVGDSPAKVVRSSEVEGAIFDDHTE